MRLVRAWVVGTLAILGMWFFIGRTARSPMYPAHLLLLESAFSAGFFSAPIWVRITRQKQGAK